MKKFLRATVRIVQKLQVPDDSNRNSEILLILIKTYKKISPMCLCHINYCLNISIKHVLRVCSTLYIYVLVHVLVEIIDVPSVLCQTVAGVFLRN